MNCYYEYIPDVILIKIFNYLRFPELCRSGEVCRRWYDVSRSLLSHRKHISIQDVVLTYHQLEKLVPQLTASLQFLHVCASLVKTLFMTPSILLRVREQCPNLNVFIIEGAFVAKDISMTDVSLNDLPANVTTLSLRRSFFHTDQFFSAQRDSVFLPKIECLDLGQCWCIEDTDIIFLNHLHHLKELYLNGCEYITRAVITQIINILPNLQILDLENTKVSNCLSMLGASCSQLQKLYLGSTGIGDLSDISLLETRPLSNLKVLCLSRTNILDKGLFLLTASHTSLIWLDISGNIISPEMVNKVKAQLPNCEVVFNCEILATSKKSCEHFLAKFYV